MGRHQTGIAVRPMPGALRLHERLYLRTEFYGKGFGYAACQPGNDMDSLAAMHREMKGGPYEFIIKGSKLVLC